MNILDKIIAHKRIEVAQRKVATPFVVLEKGPLFERRPLSMTEFIRNPGKSGIIAEFKRRSPSKGNINTKVKVEDVTVGYSTAGASALSVLTDTEFFGGASDDLIMARGLNQIPILRKDFTIDEYQIVEAKSMGADTILLIAAALQPNEVKAFCKFAHGLELQVLLEVHDEAELRDNIDADADLIGVNNRNLKTFELSIEVSKRLAPMIPNHVVKVSESGIEAVNTIIDLKTYGYQGFLMGQNFMQREEPGAACKEFIEELRAAQVTSK
ncbi:indole-3-glycerol phosphate synthase TrpC [Chryseolinea sp. T2]|uniref:indole-3-glycerol phosphate synthase TrpC n=1 Tax=Chryseolinea sp. T2 TaxID=3129255 RepID=UPI003077D4C5